MNLQRKRKRAKMIMSTGILLAAMVGATVYLIVQSGGIARAEEAIVQEEVVVAAREIASRKAIELGDLTMRLVTMDEASATTFRSVDDVVGRVSAVSIFPGQYVTPNLLASTTMSQGFTVVDPARFDPNGPAARAVSIQVVDARAVAGSIQPGQAVDILATLPLNPLDPRNGSPAAGSVGGPYVPGPSTKVTLQNVVVLSRTGELYIIGVNLEQAEQIAELTSAGGEFTLALRADIDDRTEVTSGSTIDSLVEQYDFPTPKAPPALE